MHPVVVSRRRGLDGQDVLTWDPGGAVFKPAPDRGVVVPVYEYGLPPVQEGVWTCPRSAIPDEVWTLMDLWLTCRAMKALPRAGGVLDQPWIVRQAWPVFEDEMQKSERRRDANDHARATLEAIAIVRGQV